MNLSGFNDMLADVAQTQVAPNPTAEKIKFFVIMGGMCLMMWFMIFQPQRKRAKELDKMLKSLKAGDKVVTSSGIIGVVLSLKDKSVTIRSSDTKLEILKSAIAEAERSGETSAS